MTQAAILHYVNLTLVNIAFFVCVLYPFVTKIYWDWTESWWGRNITGKVICLAIALFPSWLYFDFGFYGLWLMWLSAFGMACIIAFIVQRAFLIWNVQRNIEPDENGEKEKEKEIR